MKPKVIGKFEFIILDINSLEIQTRYKTGLICNILPFNKNNNYNNNEKYTYFALIIFENNVFYLKIYKIFDCIKEIKKINLFEYSSEFKELFDLNDILSIYNDELNKENDNGEEYYIKYIELFKYKSQYKRNMKKKYFLIYFMIVRVMEI